MKSIRRRSQALLLGLALVYLSSLAYAPSFGQQVPAKKIATVEGITEYQLDNGLRYLFLPDPAAATVTINMTVLVGSRHEGFGESGMAHLLEHMLFKGSKGFPEPDKALQAHGANYNGTTSTDRTNYFETMPATDKNLEFGIKFEADRLVNCFIKREDLAKEMSVVRNEFEIGENSPVGILRQRLFATAFEWHNYGKSVIGNRADIERVPIENLQAFYKKYYRPDNIVLVVAGKFDEAKAHQYIGKYFGVLKKPEQELPKTYTEEPPQDGEREVILRRTGSVAWVGVLYHTAAAAHPDNAIVDVLENILTSAPSGRLYKALVETKKATAVGGFQTSWHDPGVVLFLAQVAKDSSPEEVREILLKELEDFSQKPATEEEVNRSKKEILAQMDRALSNTTKLATDLTEWIAAGDWRLVYLHRDRIGTVTAEQVNQAAARYLVKSNRTVGLFIPTPAKEIARAEVPQTPDIAKLVQDYKGGEGLAKGEDFDPTPENLEKRIQRGQLPVGLKTALLPKKTTGEKVVVSLTLRFGNLESLKGNTTAASFIGPMLQRGTKKYNREQLQEELDKLGAKITAGSDTGQLNIGIQAKRSTLPAVLDLLEQMLRHPTFPEKEFDLLRSASVQSLKTNLTDPVKLAINKMQRSLNPSYPKDHVYYVPTVEESIERTEQVTLVQVVKLYQEQVGASVGELAIVGDFDAGETLSQVKRIVGDWKSKTPFERVPRKAHTKVAGLRDTIVTPDKKNAVFLAGYQMAVKDADPQYPALQMANYILGGSGFNSLLLDRLREKEGFSYGAGSQFSVSALDDYSSFLIFAFCNPENIEKVDKAAAEVLAKAAKEGITASQLEEAIKGYLQEEQVSRSNDGRLASTLAQNLYLGRTFDYQSEMEGKIAKLTVQEVNTALKTLIQPNRLIIVRAGDVKISK